MKLRTFYICPALPALDGISFDSADSLVLSTALSKDLRQYSTMWSSSVSRSMTLHMLRLENFLMVSWCIPHNSLSLLSRYLSYYSCSWQDRGTSVNGREGPRPLHGWSIAVRQYCHCLPGQVWQHVPARSLHAYEESQVDNSTESWVLQAANRVWIPADKAGISADGPFVLRDAAGCLCGRNQ